MVSTRRQSGVLPSTQTPVSTRSRGSTSAKVRAAESDDEDESMSSASEDGDASDDEDFGTARKSRRKSTAGPRATKRQKVDDSSLSKAKGKGKAAAGASPVAEGASASVVKPAAPKKRRGKDLSLLPTMPLDVLFEIFGLLGPRDLLSLTRTNKLFRATLLEPNAKGVWATCRENSGIPKPPSDFSDMKWFALLCSHLCQSCGAKGIQKVDFLLRRRICTQCKKEHLVHSTRFASRYPEYSKEILAYIPSTNVGGWSHGWSRSKSAYYWDKDIRTTAEEWETLEHAASMGSAKAKKAFQSWKDDRTAWCESIAEAAPGYTQWMKKNNVSSQNEENRRNRLQQVKARFSALGYEEMDINALTLDTDGIHTGTPNVTDAVWNRLRPKLEPTIIARKNARLERELRGLVDQRMNVLKGIYAQALVNLQPIQRAQCPSYAFLRTVPSVSDAISAPRGVVITNASFQPVINNLVEHITTHQEGLKAAAIASIGLAEGERVNNAMDLAKFVFQCKATYQSNTYNYYTSNSTCSTRLHGWSAVSGHRCVQQRALEQAVAPEDSSHKVVLHQPASDAALSLVKLAGLDPATATVADMDAKDARFVCISPRCTDATRRVEVETWRAAVKHVLGRYGTPHYDAQFRLATPDETEKARSLIATKKASARVWSCNHCHVHLGIGSTAYSHGVDEAGILQHLKDFHSIVNPALSTDYFLMEDLRAYHYEWAAYAYNLPKPPKPAKQPIAQNVSVAKASGSGSTQNANARMFLCLQCPGSKREFILGGVRAHLKDKHKIASSVIDVHYKAR